MRSRFRIPHRPPGSVPPFSRSLFEPAVPSEPQPVYAGKGTALLPRLHSAGPSGSVTVHPPTQVEGYTLRRSDFVKALRRESHFPIARYNLALNYNRKE